MKNIDSILEYWFDGLADDVTINKDSPVVKKWFTKSEETDSEIRDKFESDLIRAREGQYSDWEKSARGRLALIILCDQFSRNIYRNTAAMFESDKIALRLTLLSIEEKLDCKLPLVQRKFLYIPLMHSEESQKQKMSVACYENLLNEVKTKNPDNISHYENTLWFAKKHCEIIQRFGRFPHRNVILKRDSTLEETEFLKQPGSSF